MKLHGNIVCINFKTDLVLFKDPVSLVSYFSLSRELVKPPTNIEAPM